MFRGLIGKTHVHLILIAAIGLIAYSNTFDVPFQWDEETTIENNPIVKDLGYFLHPSQAKGLGENYLDFKSRYIGYLTFALNYKFHGLDVRGYHVVNVALHLLNAFLVYFLVRLTFKTPFMERASLKEESPYIALFVGLLFVSHPIQTEAVNYIMGRLPLLMSFFYLSSLVLYVKWRLNKGEVIARSEATKQSKSFLFYLLSLLSAVLAMKTKENAFTLPFAILLYELFFFKKASIKKRMLFLLPFALTLLIIPLTRMGASIAEGQTYSATRHFTSVSQLSYFVTQFRVVVTYIRLLFLPINQNFDYDFPVYGTFFTPPVFIPFTFLTLLAGLGVYLYIRSKRAPELRVISFGIFWFFLALSVESSIFPIPMIICEYRVYLPSVGAIIAITCGAVALLKKIRNVSIAIALLIILIFSHASYSRNVIWESKISLWEDSVRKSPFKARPHNNIAMAYEEQGYLGKAIEHYRASINLKKDYVEAYSNLGNVYKKNGMTEQAIELYKTATKVYPDFAEAYYNLGVIYAQTGFTDEAIVHFLRAVKVNPGFAEAFSNLGTAYWNKGLQEKAFEHYKIALRLKPDSAEIHYNFGVALYSKGDIIEARNEFKKTLFINPAFEQAKGYLSKIPN